MDKRVTRRTRGLPVRSVRISDEVWNKAYARAKREGIDTMSYVIALLVESYAKGLIDLPRVQLVYSKPASGGTD